MATWYVTPCPVCDGVIDFSEVELNGQVDCPDCGEVFKVLSLEPLKLSYAYDLIHEPLPLDEDYPRS